MTTEQPLRRPDSGCDTQRDSADKMADKGMKKSPKVIAGIYQQCIIFIFLRQCLSKLVIAIIFRIFFTSVKKTL